MIHTSQFTGWLVATGFHRYNVEGTIVWARLYQDVVYLYGLYAKIVQTDLEPYKESDTVLCELDKGE